MQRLFGASLAIALAAVAPNALAADLPEVKISDNNSVPACATPGRLMAYLRQRNPRTDDRFDGLATEYMRHGEELGLRWDVAFFQMILETGALRYTGDVRADQNNFAGLGASGGGKRGERFADIQSGVKAHLQHLLMYAGHHIDDPIAERTRKVQEWGVLTKWQKSISGPMTYALVAKQWAPGSRNYVRDIAAITDGFYDGTCNGPDPRPELVQEARKGREAKPETQVAELAPAADAPETVMTAPNAAPSGADIAQRAIEQARSEDPPRAALGAGMLGTVAQSAQSAQAAQSAQPAKADAGSQASPAATASDAAPPAVTLINPAKTETAKAAAADMAGTAPSAKPDAGKSSVTAESAKTDTAKTAPANTATVQAAAAKPDAAAKVSTAKTDAPSAEIQTASVAGAATQLNVPPAAKTAGKCKVWTASYGGQRAILIKASAEGSDNYTVLDVNEANEKREVDAYIAAYAKGGQRVGTFPNQTQALDKAFQLCPEG
jgi:hypothetical protein